METNLAGSQSQQPIFGGDHGFFDNFSRDGFGRSSLYNHPSPFPENYGSQQQEQRQSRAREPQNAGVEMQDSPSQGLQVLLTALF